MPVSDFYNIPYILLLVQKLKPKSVLDIGIGMGIYGYLFRTLGLKAEGQMYNWAMQIDGVEIFKEYKNPTWEFSYNKITVGDIRGVVDCLPSYDLILMSDVIEHFTKEEGLVILKKLVEKADYLLITTPVGKYPQGEYFGNIHEAHRSEWAPKDFKGFFYKYRVINADYIILVTRKKDTQALKYIASLPWLVNHTRVARLPARIVNRIRLLFK